MANKLIRIGLKFKEKNLFEKLHEVVSINTPNNSLFIKTKDSKEGTTEGKNWRLDDVEFFLSNGTYIPENQRPETTKHDQLENCGSHSE